MPSRLNMAVLALLVCITSLVSSSDASLLLHRNQRQCLRTEKNASSTQPGNVQKLQRTSNAVIVGAWILSSLTGKALSAWNF